MQLWFVRLGDKVTPDALACLSAEEKTRAASYRNERDRAWFANRRAALREILAEQTCEAQSLEFSVSHRNGLAVIAVTRGAKIGVDLEMITPLADVDSLIADYFTLPERRTLASAPPQNKARAFLKHWTRKEAILKAVGVGLAVAPNSFSVQANPDGTAKVDGLPARPWRLIDVDSKEHVITVALTPDF